MITKSEIKLQTDHNITDSEYETELKHMIPKSTEYKERLSRVKNGSIDNFETFWRQPFEDDALKNVHTKQYSTESSPIKKTVMKSNDPNYRIKKKLWSRRPIMHSEYRGYHEHKKSLTSKSTSAIVFHPHIASFWVPEIKDESKLFKKRDESTNEIESQWPQMVALFEASQGDASDEDISQVRYFYQPLRLPRFNKSDLSEQDGLVKVEDKTPPNIKSISRLSRNTPNYTIVSKFKINLKAESMKIS